MCWTFRGEIVMRFFLLLKCFLLASFLSFFFSLFFLAPLMLLATTTKTELSILEINNPDNLNIEFFDSFRGGDDSSVFYEFQFNISEELFLKKVILTKETNNEKKEFVVLRNQYNNLVLISSLEWSNSLEGVFVNGENKIITGSSFNNTYKKETNLFSSVLTDEYNFDVTYEFEEGIVNVKYHFVDQEIHSMWFWFLLLFISVSLSLTVLLFLIIHKHI
jgi:hypothetical protein